MISLITRYSFGGAIETTGSSVKKYYSFAGQTVAMKENGEFKYFLSDHLGSVSLVLKDDGTIFQQQRYLPFGLPRTMPPYDSVTSTDFTYTGQRDLPGTGLMDYTARFYSPYLNHFIQPDTIIPNPSDPQSWNRYSYVQNNPIRYNDPTGHKAEIGGGGKKCIICQDIVEFDETYSDGFTDDEKERFTRSAENIARRMARVLNDYCMKYGSLGAECSKVHPTEAFLNVFDGPVTFRSHTQTCAEHFNQPKWNCWGMAGGSSVWIFSNAPATSVAEVMQFPVHEIFHIFDNKVTGGSGSNLAISNSILMGRFGLDDGKNWQQHFTSPGEDKVGNETFADIGIAWTYNHYNPDSRYQSQAEYTMNVMNSFMEVQIINAYYGIP